MLNNLKYFIPAFVVLGFATIASAAPWYTYHASMLPVDSTENIGTSTNPWNEGWFQELCLLGDCQSTWPTGGGSSSGIASTSPWTAGQLVMVESNATTSSVGTTTLTASSPLSLSNPVFKVGGSNSVLSLDTSGTWTGNAGTATALQTARNINGVSFNGTADITITAASSTLLANNNTFTGGNQFLASTTIGAGTAKTGLTVNGAATTTLGLTIGAIRVDGVGTIYAGDASSIALSNSNETNSLTVSPTNVRVRSSAGFGIRTTPSSAYGTFDTASLSTDRTFNLPDLTGSIALGNYTSGFTSGHIPYGASGLLATSSGLSFNSSTNTLTATRLSSTHATTTNQDITGLLTFNGVTSSTWAGFCTTITGGSGLCDGTDDTGSSAYDFPLTGNATSTLTQFNGGLTAFASSTIGAGGAKTGLTISGNATTTGVIRGPSGAEAAATYSFTTDDNTGTFLVSGGTLGFSIDGTGRAALNSTAFYPYTNDATALGINTNSWSDLHLASGGIISWGNTDVQLTHSTGVLTLSSGDRLTLTNASTTNISASNSLGVASTSPWSRLSVGSGNASSSITVAEYKYGITGNMATSTTANIDCRTANQHAWPIGTSATTLTLIGLTPGQSCRVIIQNPGGGTAGGVTWAVQSGAILTWAGGTTPTRTTTANKYDVYSFIVSMGSSTMQVLGAQTANF